MARMLKQLKTINCKISLSNDDEIESSKRKRKGGARNKGKTITKSLALILAQVLL